MRLCEILSVDRILVDADGSAVRNKPEALRVLSGLLSTALGIDKAHVEALLLERERLQSTGIGDGVAIPHTAVEEAENQAAALVQAADTSRELGDVEVRRFLSKRVTSAT